MKLALRVLFVVGVLYVALFGVVLWAMSQPPVRFGRFMRHAPAPLIWGALPARQMWLWARDGDLRVGDIAPDFELPTRTGLERVRLSSFRGERPVVLVFGSYT